MEKHQKNRDEERDDFTRGGETVELPEMLDRREKRMEEIKELLEKGGTVLCFKLNIPGAVKTSDTILRVFTEGVEKIKRSCLLSGFAIREEREERLKTGPEYLALIPAEDARRVKETMITLEEEGAGRIYDIDVLTPEGSLSREALGHPERRCFLCEKEAKICARSRKHGIEEMLTAIREILRK